MRVRRSIAAALLSSGLVGAGLGIGGCGKKVDAEGRPVDVGRCRLFTFPAGARVWIDGELKVEATPATLVLKEGTYRLRLQLPGAEAVERDLEIEAGDVTQLTVNVPRPPKARVTVVSDVAGADVRINGFRRGVTPLVGMETKPGPLDVTVTTFDGRAKGLSTILEIGEAKLLEVFFEPIASTLEDAKEPEPLAECRPEPRGFLTLGLKPDGKVFDVSGELIGETPLVKRALPPGEHHVILRSSDGRYERNVKVLIEADQHAVLRFQLRDDDEVAGWRPPERDASVND